MNKISCFLLDLLLPLLLQQLLPLIGDLMLITCRRVATVRVRRIRFLVFHLEIDLQIQVVFLNTLMTLDLCKSSFHIIVILVIRIMLYLVKL